MNPQINMAIQVLPQSKAKHPYDIVDEAIRIIKETGVKYEVCPFETVMEGDYDTLMAVVKKVHNACYLAGADGMLTYLKIQSSASKAVEIDDKMGKYRP